MVDPAGNGPSQPQETLWGWCYRKGDWLYRAALGDTPAPEQPSDQPQPSLQEAAAAQPVDTEPEPEPHVPSLLDRLMNPEPMHSYDEEVTGLADRVSGFVDGFFTFVRRQATESIDLRELYRAAHSLIAEFTRLIHENFPIIPAMDPPQPVQPTVWVEPPPRPPAPLRQPPESEQQRIEHYAKLIQKALYETEEQIGLNDLQFCELSARFGLALGRQIGKGADLRYSFQSEESQRCLDELIVRLTSRLKERVKKRGLNHLKTALLEKLVPYLRESLRAVREIDRRSSPMDSTHSADAKRRQGRERQQAILDHMSRVKHTAKPYQNKEFTYKEPVCKHFNDTLKKHLGYFTSEIPELNTFTLEFLPDKIAQQLTELVYSSTSEEAVNGYFWTVMESLEGRSKSNSKESHIQGRTLDPAEGDLVMDILHTMLEELCGSGYATQKAVNYFKDTILIRVDESLQKVIAPNETGTGVKPQMGFVNDVLEIQIHRLESALDPVSLSKEQIDRLDEFYDPKNPPKIDDFVMRTALQYSGVHQGLCRLRDMSLYYPDVFRNLMVVVLTDMIETTWPITSGN